jgi:selenoprotein W-related protein
VTESEPEAPEAQVPAGAGGPKVVIEYCPRCGWLLRAAWLAQELLATFGDRLGEVALKPAGKGVFVITLEGEVLWSRVEDGGFPGAAQLKRRLRDRVLPGLKLGHVDG